MPKFHCVESTLDMNVSGWSIRLWINQQPDEICIRWRFLESLRDSVRQQIIITAPTIASVIETLSQIPDINAFQIKDDLGGDEFGVMCYTVPF